MRNLSNYTQAIIAKAKEDIHVSAIGRITRISGQVADVQLLLKKDEQDMPILLNLPILQQEYEVYIKDTCGGWDGGGSCAIAGSTYTCTGPIYRVNDIVFVVFNDYAYEGALLGRAVEPQSKRKHSYTDGLIVGRIG